MIDKKWFYKYLTSEGLKPKTGTYEDWQRGLKLLASVGRPDIKGRLTGWLAAYTNYKEG